MRLIDADGLRIVKCNPYVFRNKGYADGWNAAMDSAMSVFKNAPTIDAEPVRHGHWIPVKAMVGIDPVTMDFKIGDADRCSLCSTDFVSVQTKYKYCPFCGAKMGGESGVQE